MRTILSCIQEQSINCPDAIAVYCEDYTFTYKDLKISVDRLACYLHQSGVQEGDIAAFYMRRSFNTLIAILAIWKLDATYLAIDHHTPHERLDYILNEAKPSCIISEPALLNEINQTIPVLTLQDPAYLNCDPICTPTKKNTYKHPAYLIYTSGSTGQPKGVAITHANLANYVLWFNRHFKITSKDIFNFSSSPAFDFSITCTLTPLAAGASILITTESDMLDLDAYYQQLTKTKTTFVKWTPSYFKHLLEYAKKHHPDLSSFNYLMIAGEALPTIYVERWLELYPSHKIINEYGPTETTVGIMTQLVTKANFNKQYSTVPIGIGIDQASFYIIDNSNKLVEPGEIGELLIGGPSVAKGYYKQPSLTKKCFIKNLFSSNNEILYRTGDLVQQLPDKSYLYIGRIDQQVKVNGYRVEPTEIEHAILQHSYVKNVCLIAENDDMGGKFLAAYLVLDKEKQLSDINLRTYLSKIIPDFMIPKYFIKVSHIPLTNNNKVDYVSLRLQKTNSKNTSP
ncbi:MAG: amino acid adenylation domain-containing protein, partial [Gammaproteobacteria bacterium]|nr:amino acid adenylation domain-containing protein [Gammaproteobacteria bacterium]